MRLIVNRRLAGVPGFLLLALLAWPAAAGAQAALDPSFGSGGLARIANPIGEGSFWAEDASDVAVQPDGKILVAADGRGQDTFYWAVVRYLPDGRLDPGFGVGGVAVLTQTDPGETRGIALQPDGRIVLVGDWFKPQDANDDSVACLMRLLPDGRLDRSFSRNGVVRVDHGYGDDLLIGVEMQGRRIVAFGEGRGGGGGGSGLAAIRLRRDGSLDRTFGRRGRRVVSFGRLRRGRPASVHLVPGGKGVYGRGP